MKKKKIIRYRISVSRTFPATHPKAGQETKFVEKIQANGLNYIGEFEPKIHTIRANYELWKKRFEKIEKDEAVLELYYWTGNPYHSKCETFATLKKDDGIELQKLQATPLGWFIDDYDSDFLTKDFAKNDGLSAEDFKYWFKDYDISKPLAIIHFTKFRY